MTKYRVILLSTLLSTGANAEYLYSFGNINVNYLDWSSSTEERSNGNKQDFAYLELEGGAGFDWGEVYGFIDFEFQDGTASNDQAMAVSSKGKIAVKTGLDELRVYAQTYSTENQGFHGRNTVLGLSYNLASDSGWFFSPFVGFHYTNKNGFAGMNGGMAGWVANYDFTLGEQSFTLANWHETEFSRSNDYVNSTREDDDLSYNGALSIWWNSPESLSLGLQYRYAHNKLGQPDTDNAIIYTVKYNF